MIPNRIILPRTARPWAAFVTSVVTIVTCGCAPVGAPDPVPPAATVPVLTWLSEFTRPSGAAYPQLSDSRVFGSLSGLVRDAIGDEYVAVIDDRDGTRVAWLSIAAPGGRLDVSPRRMMALGAGPGIDPRLVTQADLEAIVALPDGTFLMAEEGHRVKGELWPPALLQVTRDGTVTGIAGFPDEFQITAGGKSGLRDNQGFESLTRTTGGRVIAGLEQPLAQHPATTPERGGEGRLIEFEPRGATWQPGRQWRYTIAPTPRVTGFPTACGDGGNGLVELLAITETLLISMERACWLNAAGTAAANPIQLFAVTLSGDEAQKTLLLDLSTITPKLSPALAYLDNFEGLAFGPEIDGRRSLLLMSDDNFRRNQKTSFLLFGMR